MTMAVGDNPPKYNIEVSPADGNAFSVMGAVRRALRHAGATNAELDEYSEDAMSGDYDHLLQVSMQWVNLQP